MNTDRRLKVFLSYSWTNEEYQKRIQDIADKLVSANVDVFFDVYDIKPGNDLNYFMEKAKEADKVLVFCDRKYADKANSREGGVGTETILLSKEVYDDISQDKVFPIIMEKSENGDTYMPYYLQGKTYLDFSSASLVSKNLEKLIRHIYNKPMDIKPEFGETPSYIMGETKPKKFNCHLSMIILKEALINGDDSIRIKRRIFVDSFIKEMFELQIEIDFFSKNKEQKKKELFEKYTSYKNMRDILLEWIYIESANKNRDYVNELNNILSKMLELCERPEGLNIWNSTSEHPARFFAYDSFLMSSAIMLENMDLDSFYELVSGSYFYIYNGESFEGVMSNFLYEPEGFQGLLGNDYSLLQGNYEHELINIESIIEAELLMSLMFHVNQESDKYWSPNLIVLSPYNRIPILFKKLENKKIFEIYSRKILELKKLSDNMVLSSVHESSRNYRSVSMRYRKFIDLINLNNLNTK